MTETTGEEASTLHRLLEIGKINEDAGFNNQSGYEGIPIDGDLSKISAEVKTDSGLEIENVAYHDGKFVTLYSKNEEVLENKETVLCELGNVVLQGIDRSVSMDEKDTSWNAKEDYKNKFIQAVVDYKKSKGEITAENNKIQAQQSAEDGFEPGVD